MYNDLSQAQYLNYPYGAVPAYGRPTQVQLPPSAPVYLKGRPVASIDEARASQIDLDGSLHVFPNLSDKKIYTKQINLDGTVTFNTFTLDESQPVTAKSPEYITREELNEAIAQLKASIIKPEVTSAPAAQKFNL